MAPVAGGVPDRQQNWCITTLRLGERFGSPLPPIQGAGPEFFKIGRRLYTTVGDLRTFIRTQRLASRPVLGKPKAV